MSYIRDRISSPLEAGTSLLDTNQYLPATLIEALEYVSERLSRRAVHVTLVLVTKDYELPCASLPSVSYTPAASQSPASPALKSGTFPSPSLRQTPSFAALKQLVGRSGSAATAARPAPLLISNDVKRAATASPTFNSHSNGNNASPRVRWPLSPSSPPLPATPATPSSTASSSVTTTDSFAAPGQGAVDDVSFGLRFLHATTLPPKSLKILHETLSKARARFCGHRGSSLGRPSGRHGGALGPQWLTTPVQPGEVGLPLDLVRRSLVQNDVVFAAEGITLLGLDRMYVLKAALAAYSRRGVPETLEEAVHAMRRIVLAGPAGPCASGRGTPGCLVDAGKIRRMDIVLSYDWLAVSRAALHDADLLYRRAYGGRQRRGVLEGMPDVEEAEWTETEPSEASSSTGEEMDLDGSTDVERDDSSGVRPRGRKFNEGKRVGVVGLDGISLDNFGGVEVITADGLSGFVDDGATTVSASAPPSEAGGSRADHHRARGRSTTRAPMQPEPETDDDANHLNSITIQFDVTPATPAAATETTPTKTRGMNLATIDKLEGKTPLPSRPASTRPGQKQTQKQGQQQQHLAPQPEQRGREPSPLRSHPVMVSPPSAVESAQKPTGTPANPPTPPPKSMRRSVLKPLVPPPLPGGALSAIAAANAAAEAYGISARGPPSTRAPSMVAEAAEEQEEQPQLPASTATEQPPPRPPKVPLAETGVTMTVQPASPPTSPRSALPKLQLQTRFDAHGRPLCSRPAPPASVSMAVTGARTNSVGSSFYQASPTSPQKRQRSRSRAGRSRSLSRSRQSPSAAKAAEAAAAGLRSFFDPVSAVSPGGSDGDITARPPSAFPDKDDDEDDGNRRLSHFPFFWGNGMAGLGGGSIDEVVMLGANTTTTTNDVMHPMVAANHLLRPSTASSRRTSRSSRGSKRSSNSSGFSGRGRLNAHLGPMTPNGYDDISPITRGEWGLLMISGDGWGAKGRTAAVETC